MRMRMLVLVVLIAGLLGAGAPDRGVLLELDRERFELVARDLERGGEAPPLRVVLGSPAHATPAGRFPLHRVIRNPAWRPGATARAGGAEPVPASPEGPLGVAKIPFAQGGEIALHGGAHPRLLGKPVSLGCVRAADADLLALLEWLEAHGALGPHRPRGDGETLQHFRRPARLIVR